MLKVVRASFAAKSALSCRKQGQCDKPKKTPDDYKAKEKNCRKNCRSSTAERADKLIKTRNK